MDPRINPFMPNSLVNPGMFAGRGEEIGVLEKALRQTRAGRPRNFMLTGERGIGKSSLLLLARTIAMGRIPLTAGDSLSFLTTAPIAIDSSTTLPLLIKDIGAEIQHSLSNEEKVTKWLSAIWEFTQRLEVDGTKLRQKSESATGEFVRSLASTGRALCDPGEKRALSSRKYDGILIVLDECDNASAELGLGAFLKTVTEAMSQRDCPHVMFGIAGLPHLRDVLKRSHPSSIRLFDECQLDRLPPQDSESAINLCIADANRNNAKQTSVSELGMSQLIGLSEGYPHFLQQFGYCAFDWDTDGSIDEKDVLGGAVADQGAIATLGNRYYRDNFYNKISSESYREVLGLMADAGDGNGWVTRAELRKQFSGSDRTLDNAVRALKSRNMILVREGDPGTYRLQSQAFGFWIKLRTHLKQVPQEREPRE